MARRFVLASALIGVLLVTAARADPIAAVNIARRDGCGLTRPPALTRSSRLDAVAWRMARGETLHNALSGAFYQATAASSMHLVGVNGDQAVARALAGRFCTDIGDNTLREVGVAQNGVNLWIVVAAPLRPPMPYEASAVSARVLTLVNDARARGTRCGSRAYPAVAPLQLAAPLTAAAHVHSDEMARYSNFDHVGHDGSTPADRVRRTGYQPKIVGENIAAGVQTPEEAVAGWLESPDHCSNIMSARYTQMGVAYATNVSAASLIYWTQVFSAPR